MTQEVEYTQSCQDCKWAGWVRDDENPADPDMTGYCNLPLPKLPQYLEHISTYIAWSDPCQSCDCWEEKKEENLTSEHDEN